MKIFLPTLFALLLACPLVNGIVCDSMVADGSTDNWGELDDCITAALSEPEKTVSIPDGSDAYKFDSYITVPENISIVGDDGAEIDGTFRLSSYSKLINLDFQDQSRAVILGQIGYSDGYITGAEVRDCTFGETGWATILAYRANDCIIDNNVFVNQAGLYPDGSKPGQNINFLGGKRNVVTNNTIYGGKTGIIFKYSRISNGGGYDSLMEDNIINGNTVEAFLEEGISFDVVGNDPDQVASLEYDTVASASGYQITLSHANWAPNGNPSYVGYDMVFLSGSLAGQTRRITVQSSATFTLDEPVTGAANGDEIVIGATFKRNIIAYNSVISDHTGSILLFGMGFYNIIENNTVTEGSISIRSLDNIERSSDSVTGTWGRAPCGYNLVKDNTVGYRIILYYRVIPEINGHANTYSPYYSYENAVINNTIADIIWANMQYYYRSGNTGGTWYPFNDVIELDSSALDITYPTPICNDGEITHTCLCGGAEYSSGYCCSGVWQDSSCSTDPEPVNITVTDCPVVHYDMDEIVCGATCSVPDNAGDHNGTVYGEPQLVDGKIGSALSFDGVDDYLDTVFMDHLSNWTVSVWAKGDALPGSGIDAGPVMKQENFILSWDHQSSRFRSAIGLSVGNIWYPASFGDLASDTWYHLVGTYDGETLRSYKDGVLITENSDPSGASDVSDYSMKIGKHSVAEYYFAGVIDEVAVWNRALLDNEVLDIYNSNQSISCSVKVHRADTSPEDGCVRMNELNWFIGEWHKDSTANPMGELIQAVELFYHPVNLC